MKMVRSWRALLAKAMIPWLCVALLLGGKWALAQAAPLTIEKQVLTLINAEREKNGLHALSWNDPLFQAARGHSEDMAAKNYFSHTSLDGTSFSQRITAAGYKWAAAAENIGAGQTAAQQIFDSWMKSDGHKKNMLNAAYCDAGIGYATDAKSDYVHYWTLDLGRQQGASQCPDMEPEPDPNPAPEPDPSVNHAPTAEAGNRQIVKPGSLVKLNGSASSDPDKDKLTFRWQHTAGPKVKLNHPASATTSFTAPKLAILNGRKQIKLVFRLVVSDGKLKSKPDWVAVIVRPPVQPDTNPTPIDEDTEDLTPQGGPPAGNSSGNYAIPNEAKAENVSKPNQVVGTGTPESCTAAAFLKAVSKGGKIVFNSGKKPVTIKLTKPAKIYNANPDVVIDGGGLVTLSGSGKTRILYMNTCDQALGWTTNHCQDQEHPRLTVQNLTFINGSAPTETDEVLGGGGAIFVRGGRLKVVNCRFFNNQCQKLASDAGGGAIRVFDQYNDAPVYVVNSTFGGKSGYGNKGANGGAISSIGVSWTIINSVLSYNQATGNGANAGQGGSGGAIYNDGNKMTLSIAGSKIEHNQVNAHGSAIFFVTNDLSGNIIIKNSKIRFNTGGSWYPKYPGISMHDVTKISVTGSIITE
jgi:hypothetical protein